MLLLVCLLISAGLPAIAGVPAEAFFSAAACIPAGGVVHAVACVPADLGIQSPSF
jgi:hypothetical protein